MPIFPSKDDKFENETLVNFYLNFPLLIYKSLWGFFTWKNAASNHYRRCILVVLYDSRSTWNITGLNHIILTVVLSKLLIREQNTTPMKRCDEMNSDSIFEAVHIYYHPWTIERYEVCKAWPLCNFGSNSQNYIKVNSKFWNSGILPGLLFDNLTNPRCVDGRFSSTPWLMPGMATLLNLFYWIIDISCRIAKSSCSCNASIFSLWLDICRKKDETHYKMLLYTLCVLLLTGNPTKVKRNSINK